MMVALSLENIGNNKNIDAIRKTCSEFCENFDPESKIEEAGDDLNFYLNKAVLEGSADAQKYVNLICRFNELTDGEVSLMPSFVDFSTADVRLMDIDFDSDGNISIKLAEI